MNRFIVEPSHFTIGGAYYPKGHVFAMFPTEAVTHRAAHKVATIPRIGAVSVLTSHDITQTFGERVEEVGGLPSVGREDQFMLRFVELAHDDQSGLLVEVAHANVQSLSQVLREHGADVAYYYRTLIIEELIDPGSEAESAASGRL